jgi:hypothetical protein
MGTLLGLGHRALIRQMEEDPPATPPQVARLSHLSMALAKVEQGESGGGD